LNYALAILSAGLLILAFPKFDLTWLAPIALAPLIAAVAREPRWRRRFVLGWLAGIVYWAGTCYWIRAVLQDHGGMAALPSWGAFTLFSLAKALHMAAFALLAGLVVSRGWAIVAIPAIWVAIERTHAPLGFAWLALGNAGVDMGAPMRLAPLAGVYGISFAFAMTGTAIALILLRRPRRELVPLLALPLLYLLPALPEAQAGNQSAVLVQPNISETADWTPEWVESMHRRLESLSFQRALEPGAAASELVIWPEVPAPMYYYEDAPFRRQVNQVARTTRAYLLLNVVAHTRTAAPLNSAVLVSPAGQPLGRYDKMFLVPFGEYVPWPFRALVDKVSTEAGDFAAGQHLVTLPAGPHPIGAFVCYESVFPHLVRRFAENGAQLLVNISNDGWYGKSAARDQHLKIVRMRAAENRRWILRATNDGITATIDPAGRVYPLLPSFVEGAARTGFSYIGSVTPYTRFGDWFVLVCAVVGAGLILLAFVPPFPPARSSVGKAGGRERSSAVADY
jgi:apolipoprotein N-acyltransferase